MSVLIKGVELPNNCTECPCLDDEYFLCRVVNREPEDENIIKRRPDWCPLIELPPHGDLIDRDALKFRLKTETGYAGSQQITTDFLCVLKSDIVNAPTIIESEEEDG